MKHQNFEYFVESLLKNGKNKEYNYKNIDFKNSVIRANYQQLVNDQQLHEFFLKKQRFFFSSKLTKDHLSNKIKKKNFYQNYLSLSYLKSFLKISELPYFFYHLLFNMKFNFKETSLKKQKKIGVYVNSLKHYYHQKEFLSSIKNKIVFITLSKALLKKLPNKEKASFTPLEIVKPSFAFNTKALSKEMYILKVFRNFITDNNIKLVIGTEGDCPIFELLCIASKLKNIKSICVQWGAIPFVRPRLPFDNMSCDYFFSWGKFFENQLKKKNKETTFVSIGRKTILKKINRKKIITFIMAPPVADFPEEYNFDLLEISKYIAKKYNTWNCIIRNHPLYEIKPNMKYKIKNLKFESYYDNPIDLCLKKSSVVVGIASSVLIEAIYHNTIPVVYEINKNHKFYPRFDKNKIGFIRNDVKSLINALEDVISNKIKFNKTMNLIKINKFKYFSNINKDLNHIIKKQVNKIYNY